MSAIEKLIHGGRLVVMGSLILLLILICVRINAILDQIAATW